MRRPPQFVEKASQSFAPCGRERDCNHFRRRRVRRRKYFSRSECRIVRLGGQPRVPNECESHSLGEEEQRNDRALGFSRERGICSSRRRSAAPVSIGRSRPGDFIVKKGRREPFLTVSGGLRKLRRPPAKAPRIYLRGSYLQGAQAIALVEAHTRAFDCPVLPGAA